MSLTEPDHLLRPSAPTGPGRPARATHTHPGRRRTADRAQAMTARLAVLDAAVPLVAALAYPTHALAFVALAVALCLTCHHLAIYDIRFTMHVLDDLPRASVALAVGGCAAWAGSHHLVLGSPDAHAPVGWIVLVTAVVAMLSRVVLYRRWRTSVDRDPAAAVRVLLVGEAPSVADVARQLTQHPGHLARPVGILGTGVDLPSLPVDHVGGYVDYPRVADELDIDVALFVSPALPESRIAQMVRYQPGRRITTYTVPPGYGLGLWDGTASDHLAGIPLVQLEISSRRGLRWRVKRAFDVVAAGTALVALSPVMLLTALAVRLEIGPSIIFRQTRIGHGGRPFTLYKFTSMRPVDDSEADTRWSIAGDDRIGRVGAFIRATSLDELPQLVNILKGDMSVVGPRPERPHFVDRYGQEYEHYAGRHRVPVGLTGLAAVRGLRGDTSIAARAHYDNVYIDHWSLWRDVKIMLWTVGSVLRRHGS